MKKFFKKHDASHARNTDKYDQRDHAGSNGATVTGALIETVWNPFFVLGRR